MWPRIRKFVGLVFLGMITVAALVYGGDYLVFRVRAAAGGNPFGSVTVRHYYAVQEKNGRTQFLFDPPSPQTCVRALFSHSGFQPCWYTERHPEQRTDI